MTDQQTERTWRDRLSDGLKHLLASPHDPPHSSEPVGRAIHPDALALPKEDWVLEMTVRYGDDEYKFVEENGELRLERWDND